MFTHWKLSGPTRLLFMFMFLGGCMSFISCLSHKNGTDHMQVFISWVLDIQCHLFFSVGYSDEPACGSDMYNCHHCWSRRHRPLRSLGSEHRKDCGDYQTLLLRCHSLCAAHVLSPFDPRCRPLFIVLLLVRSLLLTCTCWTEWMSVQFLLYTEARWMYTLNFTLHIVWLVKN